ncbi:CBS domain-containing protein [Actinoplanes aureus]|uniref:CBS domain-containing protein n=1 Tax=Actinoplanes aureus TaxID=2792083 RepID=A0A931FZI1_9ACTN|nr:CBS domain-containing protein [Actinoplanes aureus]MBG0564795.1 CBS domain-containing protein [Actinoplanes aureus]
MQWHVDDVMTRDVTTVSIETPLHRVAGLLDREGISAVPVITGDGRVAGIVTQADLLTGIVRGSPRIHRDDVTPPRAGDVMTAPVVHIGPDATLPQAAHIMQRRGVRRLVVTDPRGRLLGVVSRSDLLRPHARGDAAIGGEVAEVLRRRLWIGPPQLRAHVREGTVVLTGDVDRRSTADIAARLTAAVPGVTAVADRIRFGYDDGDLVRSRVSSTHPFSAEPFPPGRS